MGLFQEDIKIRTGTWPLFHLSAAEVILSQAQGGFTFGIVIGTPSSFEVGDFSIPTESEVISNEPRDFSVHVLSVPQANP